MQSPTDPSQFFQERDLLEIEAPAVPADFEAYWRSRYLTAIQQHPRPEIRHTGRQQNEFEVYDLQFQSTDGVSIGGWVTIPTSHPVRRVLIVGHGYGGCPEPGDNLPLRDAAYVWPCLRGLGRSAIDGVPQDPYYHVQFNLDDRDSYILGGCVEDLWLAVSVAEKLFPASRNRIGLMGISFSGGIGVLAAAWDDRVRMLHVEVPTFGNHELRMTLPSWGSAKALQDFSRKHPDVLKTLSWFDAAIAAQFVQVPTHVAAALHDPFVAPPGQFAIYNALNCERDLFVLEQGHSEYANQETQQQELLEKLKGLFSKL